MLPARLLSAGEIAALQTRCMHGDCEQPSSSHCARCQVLTCLTCSSMGLFQVSLVSKETWAKKRQSGRNYRSRILLTSWRCFAMTRVDAFGAARYHAHSLMRVRLTSVFCMQAWTLVRGASLTCKLGPLTDILCPWQVARYCSRECQLADWRHHRKYCSPEKAPKPAEASRKKGTPLAGDPPPGCLHDEEAEIVSLPLRDGFLDAGTIPDTVPGDKQLPAVLKKHFAKMLREQVQPPRRWYLPNVYGSDRCAGIPLLHSLISCMLLLLGLVAWAYIVHDLCKRCSLMQGA